MILLAFKIWSESWKVKREVRLMFSVDMMLGGRGSGAEDATYMWIAFAMFDQWPDQLLSRTLKELQIRLVTPSEFRLFYIVLHCTIQYYFAYKISCLRQGPNHFSYEEEEVQIDKWQISCKKVSLCSRADSAQFFIFYLSMVCPIVTT